MKRKKKEFSSRKSFSHRGTKCLNCGHPLDRSDIYCPHCSQLNSTKHLSFTDFFSEFLSSILVYDSRLRSTLKDLLFRPGVMSQNYIKGQRLKYANPFRFFLSVSIIFFLMKGVLGMVTNSEEQKAYELDTQDSEERMSSIFEIDDDDILFYNKKDSITAERLGIPFYYSEKVLDSLPFSESYGNRVSLYLYYYHLKREESSKALLSLNQNGTLINNWLYARTVAFYKIFYDPVSFVKYILPNVPFFLFFFTPLFAFFFWLIYSKSQFSYMEHVIFIFHIFSFIFLALLIFLIPNFFLNNFLGYLLFLIIGPVYFYLALKKFYGQSKLVTLIKFVFLSIIFNIGFFVASILFVAASAAIY